MFILAPLNYKVQQKKQYTQLIKYFLPSVELNLSHLDCSISSSTVLVKIFYKFFSHIIISSKLFKRCLNNPKLLKKIIALSRLKTKSTSLFET